MINKEFVKTKLRIIKAIRKQQLAVNPAILKLLKLAKKLDEKTPVATSYGAMKDAAFYVHTLAVEIATLCEETEAHLLGIAEATLDISAPKENK